MGRAFWICLVFCLAAAPAWPQADSRTILGGGNEFLSAGSMAIRLGRYDEGIRLTMLGLERYQPSMTDRANALSNLCAAYAARGELDAAMRHCNESLLMNPRNWRAYSNRSYVYYLKGMYSEAVFDLDAAAAINPEARQLSQIRGLINEKSLSPRVIMEDHQ
jgi:tetratricopeptide (TPR) repeat protein